MPAQRRQTGITKKNLQYTVMSVHRRNALKKKIETENPIPALFQEFEERTKEVERLRRRIKEETALADMAFAKMKKFGIDGYNTIKVEDEEDEINDDLEDYLTSYAPTPQPPTPPRRSNRIKNRPFNEDQLRKQTLHPIITNPNIAGPSQPRLMLGPPSPRPTNIHQQTPTIYQPIPGLRLPPPFDPRLIGNLPFCNGCQHYGHHVLYCPEAELEYPPEE
jgi:hypothetical protein